MYLLPISTFLLFRYLTACLFLYPVFRFAKGKLPAVKPEHLGLFAVTGLMGYGLAIALQQVSTDMLDASLAALINATNPIFICILAFFLLKESITKEQILGILLAIIGIYLVLGISSGSGISALGILVSLGSVFFWSLASFL